MEEDAGKRATSWLSAHSGGIGGVEEEVPGCHGDCARDRIHVDLERSLGFSVTLRKRPPLLHNDKSSVLTRFSSAIL